MTNKINIALLISGSGRTLQNFIDKINNGYINANIKLVISSNPSAYGVERAKKHGIKTAIINPNDFTGTKLYSEAITTILDKQDVDLILLAGFSHFYYIPDKYIGKVMNIHPSLIPSFCGKGFYGHLVHEAAVEYGVKISGCTVHFADNKYDNGPIILQRTIEITEDDTPETLAEKVFKEECLAFPEAVKLFADGKLKIVGRKVMISTRSQTKPFGNT